MVYHRIWIYFPVLCSRTLLFIHSLYNSLHLLISNSQFIPPPPPPPWQPQACSPCLWVCVCFLNNPRRALMQKKGRAVLCKNWEHPEKLIKTFPFDYTLEDGNSFLSRLSLTQLAQEECKGWVGSFPTWEWKEATYQRDDGVRGTAAADSTSTLWDSHFAIFQRWRQLTGKKKNAFNKFLVWRSG